MPADPRLTVQIFGFRDSRATQHAIRFFRERRANVAFVDLAQRPIARGELQRFIQRFGAAALIDDTGRPFHEAGLAYMRLDESEIFERLLVNSRLIKLPLVRRGNALAVGSDEAGWRRVMETP